VIILVFDNFDHFFSQPVYITLIERFDMTLDNMIKLCNAFDPADKSKIVLRSDNVHWSFVENPVVVKIDSLSYIDRESFTSLRKI